jgi:ABC-type uncharacterized transport system substrate-binding protein
MAVRRALPTVVLLAGASALLLATDRAQATRTVPAVAVLQQVSTTLLDDAVRGMIDGLAERGYVAGKTVVIRRYNAEGDLGQANAIAREIAGGAFDLALTSSTPSLQALATANARGRILHVFSAVADPFSAGVSFDFHKVGLLAGRRAGELLDRRDPATVPISETAREMPPRLSINLAAPGYDRSRWRVTDALLEQAKVVIDEAGRRDQPAAVLAGPFTEAEPSVR